MTVSKKVVELYLPSELGYEKIAIAAAAFVAEKMGFSPDRIGDLKTAVGEAVANAIEHGNAQNAEIKVLFRMTILEEGLALNVVDHGQTPIPAPTGQRLDRTDHRGLGMFLITNLVDEVKVSALPGRNEIEMTVHLESG